MAVKSYRLRQIYTYSNYPFTGFPSYESADRFRRKHCMGKISPSDTELSPICHIDEDEWQNPIRDENGELL
jgi:hypothetical protein